MSEKSTGNGGPIGRWEDCGPGLEKAIRAMRDALAGAAWKLSEPQPINWQKGIHGTDSPGVYLIFDTEDRLIYVGKAEQPLGKEVWSKFRRGASDDDIRWKEWPEDQIRPAKVATIAMGKEEQYLAPALEGILIEILNPQLNVLKKRKDE